ncbi:hypothetical protein AVO52_18055 [Vibrio cholerae]|nr:hypothetical protein AVO52_18055 [Vibrio cholerae]
MASGDNLGVLSDGVFLPLANKKTVLVEGVTTLLPETTPATDGNVDAAKPRVRYFDTAENLSASFMPATIGRAATVATFNATFPSVD